MRLFAALLPPAPVLAEIGRVADRPAGRDGPRWTRPSGRHITLAFYGDVPRETVPELAEGLARAAAGTRPFGLVLRGGGHFGGRALWAGVGGETAALTTLAERAEAAGRACGLPGEDRPYQPHLTLARGRAGIDLGPYAEALGTFAGTPWTVGELALVRSDPPVPGMPGESPHYEKVAAWAFPGAR